MSNSSENSAERDAGLIRRIAADDPTALTELAWSYAQRLGDAAMIITHSPDLAQDAVQDTFIWLWDNRKRINIQNSLLAYLTRAVRNRAQNIVRHENAHQQLEARVHHLYGNEEPRMEQGFDSALIREERTVALQRALDELSPAAREVFLLRIDAGLSYAEIAEAMSISLSAVKNHIHRTTKELEERLAGL